MSKFPRVARWMAAVAFIPTTLSAQKPLPYPWQTQSAPSYAPVEAGTSIEIQIGQLNRVCFRYTVSSKQTPAVIVASTSFLETLGVTQAGMAGLPSTNDKTGINTPTPAATSAKSASGKGTSNFIESVSKPPVSAGKLALEELVSAVDAAYKEVADATAPVEAAQAASEKATKALNDFYAAACAGSHGSADPAADWGKASDPIIAFATDGPATLKAADAALKRAKKSIEVASASLTLFDRKADAGVDDFAAIRGLNFPLVTKQRDLIDVLSKRAGDAATLLPKLLDDAKAKDRVATETPAALKNTQENRIEYVDPNTDQLTVTITATRLHGTGDAQTVDIVPIPVHRTNRFFLTAGFMFSSLDEHSYDRATVIDADGKEYSTFVDRAPSSSVAFSPTLLAHMTVAGYKGYDLSLSAGVAMRSVNDKTSPEFVFGPSFTIRDAFAVTTAFHRGRVETLLLGDPDTVKRKPVPDDVTRAGAVGQRWSNAFAVIASFKLPQ